QPARCSGDAAGSFGGELRRGGWADQAGARFAQQGRGDRAREGAWGQVSRAVPACGRSRACGDQVGCGPALPRPAYFTVKRSVAGGMVASRVLVVASPLSLLPAMSRFFVFVPALFVALVSHSPAAPLEYFRPEQVRLLPGPFLHAQDLLIEQLLAHDVDRFLAPFRSEAGLEPKAPKYPNWESSGLDGHTAGHYLTALAQLSASTGHPEITRRLDVMLAEF